MFNDEHYANAVMQRSRRKNEWSQHPYKASLIITNVRNGGEDYDIVAETRDAKLPVHTAEQIVAEHNLIVGSDGDPWKAVEHYLWLMQTLREEIDALETWRKAKGLPIDVADGISISLRKLAAIITAIEAAQ